MALPRTFKGSALALAVCLAVASPALAAPAGDEYLPGLPNATGDGTGGDGDGTAPSGASTASDASSDQKKGKKAKDDEKADDEKTITTENAASEDDDDSGGVLDTLLDPVILVLIAGVLTIVVGMTLKRRQGAGGPDPDREPRDPSSAPPTPEGEITGGERGGAAPRE